LFHIERVINRTKTKKKTSTQRGRSMSLVRTSLEVVQSKFSSLLQGFAFCTERKGSEDESKGASTERSEAYEKAM
jgi:hypothetical protein